MGGGAASVVEIKPGLRMGALQILTSPLEAYVTESPQSFFFNLYKGKNNMPALPACEAQNKIIKVKAPFSLKSAIQNFNLSLQA